MTPTWLNPIFQGRAFTIECVWGPSAPGRQWQRWLRTCENACPSRYPISGSFLLTGDRLLVFDQQPTGELLIERPLQQTISLPWNLKG